jgi:C_GCAxxG_C_C family probable redox protein
LNINQQLFTELHGLREEDFSKRFEYLGEGISRKVYALNEEYVLNLVGETFKTMAAFGGGMAVESVCGAATGAIAVLGIIFTDKRAHESEKVKLLTIEFMKKFEAELGTLNCRELKERFRNDEVRCIKMVETAA